jgi:hypothetical protein
MLLSARKSLLATAFFGFSCLAAVAVTSESVVAQQATAPAQPAPKKSVKKAAPAGDAAAKPDAAQATATIEQAAKLTATGKVEPAISSLSSVISRGGLPPTVMAKALYQRGLAYRAAGKQPQAISDLTSALWLKNGLSETERADAVAKRSQSYRDAGLPDQSDGSEARAAAAPAAATPAAAAAAPPARTPVVRSVAAKEAAPAPAVPVPAPTETTAVSPERAAARIAARERRNTPDNTASIGEPNAPPPFAKAPAATTAPAAAPAAATAGEAAPAQQSAGGLGSLFGSLFGGGSASNSQWVASKSAPTEPKTAAVSAWSDQTEVQQKTARKAPAAPPPAAAAPATIAAATTARTASAQIAAAKVSAAGRFRVQLAMTKSKVEAQALADKAKAQMSGESRIADIVETTFGGATYYRVRLGPYASQQDGAVDCARIKSAVGDCLVVVQ